MQLRVGSYSFDANSVRVASESEQQLNEAMIPFSRRTRLRVHGYLAGSGQADLSTKEAALRAALLAPYPDVVLFHDNGTPSATALTNAGSRSGVIVDRGPDFPGADGAEYATQREFTFECWAEYPLTQAGPLIRFRETLQFGGGLPLYAMKRGLSAPPQRQLVCLQPGYTARQTGEAVGYLAYPPVPPPIWPFALMKAGEPSLTSPDRFGPLYQHFGATWSYEFESAAPLVGSPHLWL